MVIKDVQRGILSSDKYAQLQKSLKLFFDENKILRCGGRLSQAPLEYGAKFPIILPGSHDVTKLIVRKCHETVGHNGVKDTLTQLRDKYWLVKGRQVIKKLIKDCVVCRKLEGQGYFKPPIPSLPELRLKDDFEFSHCGCEFCEPEYVETKEEIIVTTENLSRRAKYLQTLLSQFWSRWRRESLSELREAHSHVARSYKSTGERFIKQDYIVLISEDRVPRNTWRVGKVESLIESKDGCVRGANVKVFSKERKKPTIIQRPVQKLYPVEADIDLKVKEKEGKRDIIKSESHESNLKERPCRDAKVLGELKRKYVNN